MKEARLTDVLYNEISLLGYSLRMLVGRNLLAVVIISVVLLGSIFSSPVSTGQTKLVILLKQLELFAPLLGIVIFSDLIAGDVQARRATLLMCSRSGIVPVVLRKLMHGLLITCTTYLMILLTLRVCYTSFNLGSAFVIAVPGALYFGMLGLLGATFTSQALAGYAVGTAALILSMVVKQAMPLVPTAFQMKDRLATATLFASANWVFAKVVFCVLACVLAGLVLMMARRRSHRFRVMGAALVGLAGCYAVLHTQWSREVPPDIYYANPGQPLEVIQTDDHLVIRSAAVRVYGRGKHKANEEALLTDTLYQSSEGHWIEQEKFEYDPSHDYDLVHLDIDANVAPAEAGIDAHARARIKIHTQDLTRLYMRLAWELQVTQIRVNGTAALFSRLGDLLEIPLTGPVMPGQTVTVEMDYGGTLRLPSHHHRSEHNAKDILMVNSRWYPFVKSWYHEGPSDLCSFDTRITVPRDWQVGAGELISSQGADRTWQFSTDTPSDRIGLVITRFREHKTATGDISVTVYGHSMSDATMREIGEQACDTLRYLEKTFGKYPHQNLTIVEYDYMNSGGVACPSIVLMNTKRCRPEVRWDMLNFYIPHEIAHQWFSSALPPWIAETSAVFADYLYLAQQADNEDDLARFHKALAGPFEAKKNYPLAVMGSQGIMAYIKGAYLMMMLTSVDEPGTVEALTAYLQDQIKLQSVDHDDAGKRFLEAMQRVDSGKRAAFVSDWLRSTDRFDPAVSRLVQTETPEGFVVKASLAHHEPLRFSVPLRLTLEDGTHVDAAWNSGLDADSLAWTLDQPVRSITLDPDHILLDWNRRNNLCPVSSVPDAPVEIASPAVPLRTPQEHWTTYTTANGLLTNRVRHLSMDAQGRPVAALNLISKKPGTYVQTLASQWVQPDRQSRASGPVYAVAAQPDGTLWTGGAGSLRRIKEGKATIFALSESRGRYSMNIGEATLEPNPKANSMIPGCVVYDMTTDARGRVWLATDHGISVLDGNATLLKHMTTEHGLPSNEVLCMAWQDPNTLWIGTDKGCATFSQDTWRVPARSPNDLILSIAADSKGQVYLGTYRHGVLVHNGTAMRHYNSFNSRLPHDMVTALVCDQNDRVWAGTNLGLWCKDDQTERTFTTENSGLLSSDVTDLALNDHALWIATDAGIAVYDLSTAPKVSWNL